MKINRIDNPEESMRILRKIMNRQDTPKAKPYDTRLFLRLCDRYFKEMNRRFDALNEIPLEGNIQNPNDEQTGKTLR